MRIAICDDMQSDRDVLKSMLEAMEKNCIVTEFADGQSLVDGHARQKFDVILLDCIMPGMSGIATASEIRKNDMRTPIVFISSSKEFGVDSYRVLAYDYILKPIDKKVLSDTLKRLADGLRKKQYITITLRRVNTKILLSNIICVESNLHKIIFSLVEGRMLYVSAKLSDYEKELTGNTFIRCHKSYLVNAMYIDSIEGDTFSLTNGRKLKISRAYLADAKRKYFNFVFGGGETEND